MLSIKCSPIILMSLILDIMSSPLVGQGAPLLINLVLRHCSQSKIKMSDTARKELMIGNPRIMNLKRW